MTAACPVAQWSAPALQRLLAEVDAGRIGMIGVYKIDRLTRSLADFARLVEQLERRGCSFVSVTQAFNTSTSMGRLTLNVLLSSAQFELEFTAERIRDKIAASKRKGLWMGGTLPLGYDPPSDPLKARVREINPAEAITVRRLFAPLFERGQSGRNEDRCGRAGPQPAQVRPYGRGGNRAWITHRSVLKRPTALSADQPGLSRLDPPQDPDPSRPA
ncbi:MAG: resolvase [Cypionkella sp.]|nr:resolvase [Cypionkella sp.]